MPVYTYEVINPDGSPGETFELLEPLSAVPLERHPDTGRPVRRVFGHANIGGEWGEGASKHRLSDDNLRQHGFTKYQRVGKGQFERRVGSAGPSEIAVD